MYGGYVCSGNCVEPSIWLTISNIKMVNTASPFCRHTSWCCSVVYWRKSDENGRFLHFTRHFTLKPLVRRLCMLRELFRTFNMAHHNQYQDDLHSQSILQAYIMMLQCVYSRKSDENGRFLDFTRHFTLKPFVRWLCMLRELCRTFNIAHHM